MLNVLLPLELEPSSFGHSTSRSTQLKQPNIFIKLQTNTTMNLSFQKIWCVFSLQLWILTLIRQDWPGIDVGSGSSLKITHLFSFTSNMTKFRIKLTNKTIHAHVITANFNNKVLVIKCIINHSTCCNFAGLDNCFTQICLSWCVYNIIRLHKGRVYVYITQL